MAIIAEDKPASAYRITADLNVLFVLLVLHPIILSFIVAGCHCRQGTDSREH